MRSDWRTVKLGEITDWSSGGTPSKSNPDFWNGDIPWISASSMEGNRYCEANHYISQEALKKSRLAPKGTILLLVRGSILHQKIQVGITTKDVAFNQDVKCLSVNKPEVDPRFILYWLEGNRIKLLGLVENTGIGAGKLDTKLVQNLDIHLPPKKERDSITHIISSLDDKIELNRQMNETLEAMAQTLFKNWFVDFDPVIDKALAAGNEIPEPLQQRAQLRQQVPDEKKLIKTNPELVEAFPDRFTFTEELGWIPEGWEVLELRQLVSVVSKGTTPRKSEVIGLDDSVPFLKARDISDDGQISDELDCIPEEVHTSSLKRSILETGDLLITIAGTIGRVTELPIHLDQSNCNQAIAFIRLKNKELMKNSILMTLRSDLTTRFINEKIVQAVQANISLETVKSIPCCKPSNVLLKEWNKLIDPLMDRKYAIATENKSLNKIRDTLLPKLISGELRVPEAEKLIADHV